MTRLVLGLAFLVAAAPAFSSASAQDQPSLTEQLHVSPAAAIETTEAAPEAQPLANAVAASKAAIDTTMQKLGKIGSGRAELDAMIARHAASHGVPLDLAHRVVIRESRYNTRAVSKGNYGLMQIRLGTARGLGYRGDASGLLDPETNLTYAMKYLAGAYKVAGGNSSRAVSYYSSGYYYATKRQGGTRSASAAN